MLWLEQVEMAEVVVGAVCIAVVVAVPVLVVCTPAEVEEAGVPPVCTHQALKITHRKHRNNEIHRQSWPEADASSPRQSRGLLASVEGQ